MLLRALESRAGDSLAGSAQRAAPGAWEAEVTRLLALVHAHPPILTPLMMHHGTDAPASENGSRNRQRSRLERAGCSIFPDDSASLPDPRILSALAVERRDAPSLHVE